METLECILSRRSVRKFQEVKLPDDIIRHIVEHAKFAPSWANRKTTRYLCIQNDALKEKVAVLTGGNAAVIKAAPALFVLTAVTGRSGQERDGTIYNHTGNEWTMFDAGLAAEALCLAAWDVGIGTTVMGAYQEQEISALLDLPEDQMLIALIPAGYPAENPVTPRRKAVAEILKIIN